MTKCLCVILARSGSKRIKDKNIKLFNNKPLFYYSILFAKKLNFIDEILFIRTLIGTLILQKNMD